MRLIPQSKRSKLMLAVLTCVTIATHATVAAAQGKRSAEDKAAEELEKTCADEKAKRKTEPKPDDKCFKHKRDPDVVKAERDADRDAAFARARNALQAEQARDQARAAKKASVSAVPVNPVAIPAAAPSTVSVVPACMAGCYAKP